MRTIILLLILSLTACATPPQTARLLDKTPHTLPTRHHIEGVPFFAQEKYQCGPASLAMALRSSGVDIQPSELVAEVYVPERRGSFQVEMVAAARKHQRLPYIVDPSIQTLLTHISQDQPVLVLQNLGLNWFPQWHYAVVVGYDLADATVTLHSGTTKNYTIKLALFERTWKRADLWGVAILQPGALPALGDPAQYFLAAAAYERHADTVNAAKVWKAGIGRWPKHIELLMGYGNFHYNQSALAQAESAYRQAIYHDPDYAPAYNNLAQVLIDRRRYQEALAMADKALGLDHQNPVYLETRSDAARNFEAHHNPE